ncbi:DUF5801 domain-containing protein [Bradyrhizobium huanghuaihaiense]|uniref:DUF5801 repeats-in-toxin domain-containing protein n=1 Tax=Bradyrhizobium huanghuaihaiense TaxID=990078 RepID=UPI0021A9E61F|nr:DUF5801 repeats-in-toxin domain-containing protein [Bradyrhizobium sp. CB3035]UWU75277.1 DUF5801 domain-containing protein [Bradyrhizobium sp. CB3035]
MALDILTQDIIVDESIGFQDSDIDPSVAPYDTNTTVNYLLGRDGPGGLASPQVAVQTNFVQATADAGETITSIILTKDANGNPFSTAVGVNSGIKTVDGNYVWLFQDATPNHANVVIGVIGTSDANAAPAATGALAFSFALVSTSNTAADLYLVQYVPLFHPDDTNPDDRIDLSNKVFASVTGTVVVNFSQLGDAPPGHNNWYILDADVASSQKILVTAHDNGVQAEVNVSTQGLGVASQDVRFGRELQIDLISGGTQSAGKNFTNAPLAPDYGSHLENVSSAGFSVSQSTPTNTVADIEIHAYNNNDNAEGAALPGDDNDTEINITGATFKLNGVATTAAALGITVDTSGTGLILHGVGEGVTVDFTTAGGAGGTFDRFTIKNIDTQKDYFDVKEVHFGGEQGNARNEEVGSFINFDDDGPTLSITAAPTVGSATVIEASGVAGQNQATITPPTFTASAVDGYTTDVSYALGLAAGTATGLQTTDGNHAITLVADSATQISGKYDSDGNGSNDATAFTVTLSGTTVTLRSFVALEHSNAPQGAGEDNTLDLNGLINVKATVTVTDGDHDPVSKDSTSGTLSLTFNDTDPTLSITAVPVVGSATVTEASGAAGQSQATITAPGFTASAVDGYTSDVSYVLSLVNATTGLQTTEGNHAITLVADSATQISGKYDSNGDTTLDATAFTVTLSGATVTLTSSVALEHSNAPQGAGEDNTLDLDGLIKVVATVTVTDGDNDSTSSQSTSAGLSLTFNDTDPTITVQFDGDPGTAGTQRETLTNAVGATASGAFGFDMTDKHTAAEYSAGVSDFVDANTNLAGVQIGLTGTIDNNQNPDITDAVATLTAEDATSATFGFSFHYDKDPITVGVQDSQAAGTLVFDKVNDTYTFTLTDAIDGFSFDVLHTSGLVAKQPTGNTGHPLIVAEQLTPDGDPSPFFVQFTGNSVTTKIGFGFNSTGDGAPVGDTTFNNGGATHDMVTNTNEDWVSATQATNGVAGDTIQKGELLTLRFFNSNILGDVNPGAPGGGTEKVDPSATASGIVVKFDGIGSSEDLLVILDLKDAGGNEITRAINVENSDLIKGNANIPPPYNTEFTLDNNDALLIIEQNDYTVAGETYQIQGIQIMQSSNGLTGDAINLNGATGTNGFSKATTQLTAWDPTDNDVLKIVDIGFVQQNSGSINASLDFALTIGDADGDVTTLQHLLVDVLNA